MSAATVVVVLGDVPSERIPLSDLAGKFGWSIERVEDLNQLRDLTARRRVASVLCRAQAWELRDVLDAAPRARVIVCHEFSDEVVWPRLAAAGAFHSLHLPFRMEEVRQSLGFVWAAAA